MPSIPLATPPFGEATLANCEREQIHLAGSIQPHGVLLVVRHEQLGDRLGGVAEHRCGGRVGSHQHGVRRRLATPRSHAPLVAFFRSFLRRLRGNIVVDHDGLVSCGGKTGTVPRTVQSEV